MVNMGNNRKIADMAWRCLIWVLAHGLALLKRGQICNATVWQGRPRLNENPQPLPFPRNFPYSPPQLRLNPWHACLRWTTSWRMAYPTLL